LGAVVRLSASAMMIGLTHLLPPAGALILVQAKIKLVVITSNQMGRDFCQLFDPGLSGFEGGRQALVRCIGSSSSTRRRSRASPKPAARRTWSVVGQASSECEK